ncbi:helix-turn-helix domain-containing protein [Tunturiibacter psychrotolerans]|uniref:helix-turn-helix domain-containing protein n=1 Tax=Tunturiibacter psychrotolerans TaxID=3069686 RepID=UPI003D200DFC
MVGAVPVFDDVEALVDLTSKLQRSEVAAQRKLAKRLVKEGKSVREIARTFSVHPATLYRILTPIVDK